METQHILEVLNAINFIADCSRVSMRGCMVSEATLDDLISRDTIGNLSITNDICKLVNILM